MNAVIIVAGGKGSRFGGDTPKQFLSIENRPVYIYTIEQFIKFDKDISVVLVITAHSTTEDVNVIQSELTQYSLSQVKVVYGGSSRYQSVKNGLSFLSDHITIVGVHDAVRPLISKSVISNCFITALKKGNAVPAVPLKDSLRQVQGSLSKAVDRNQFRLIQTPQCFNKEQLLLSYNLAEQRHFTDDASVFEAAGHKIKLVEGDPENIKITTPPDLLFVKYVLAKRRD